MKKTEDYSNPPSIMTFSEFAQRADYTFMDSLSADPKASKNGHDHRPREVKSGHYVPVKPTPIASPNLLAYSPKLFQELGLDENLAHDKKFRSLFSGDLSIAQKPMRPVGWATGYALSIYGTEYNQQCPFGTGNAYGDGRAISVFEGCFEEKRWEMQLKGSGRTPYCRGADGRAVLRSSVREFLAQEFMHALGVPSSRSLTLYMSESETVRRPWYSQDSESFEPDILVANPVAISTRVAPSFLRVGQLELFARRVRSKAHPKALQELKMIVEHLIARNYREQIDIKLSFGEQILELAQLFRTRLISLVSHWLRVGYCQGNFNSDNCAAGGFTLDYGPFGFCELFDPRFQPWTGGGAHFSFFNQPVAAEKNFHMFWQTLRPLLADQPGELERLDQIRATFAEVMKAEIDQMWAKKLGLKTLDRDLLKDLFQLMLISNADYTIFFRELSKIPSESSALQRSFYPSCSRPDDERWSSWLERWRNLIANNGDLEQTSSAMKQINPSITWREWLIAPAYQEAESGESKLIRELQEVFSHPYQDLPLKLAKKYDRLRPQEFFNAGGISHYSCSS